MRLWNWLMVTSFFVAAASYGASSNEKLGDVMQMLADQSTGIAEVSRRPPAEVDARTFQRALARARGAQWLLARLHEDAGEFGECGFKAEALTPGKLVDAEPEAVEALLAQYREALGIAAAKFAEAEAALKTQSETDPMERDFTELKKAVRDIALAMAAGHRIFKP